MVMSRNDYIAIAAGLSAVKPEQQGSSDSTYLLVRAQWRAAVKSVADSLARTQPRFNRATFYAACRYEE